MNDNAFSNKLEAWLKTSKSKNLGSLDKEFGRKSFAVAFIILMAPAALPIPTGGITHLFELISIIIAIEMIIGRNNLWIPTNFLRSRSLPSFLDRKGLPKFIKFIHWFEKYSKRRRGLPMPPGKIFYGLSGILILAFIILAFFAPPFSMLDTLPALAVVVISLSFITEDFFAYFLGILCGVIGLLLFWILGTEIINIFSKFI